MQGWRTCFPTASLRQRGHRQERERKKSAGPLRLHNASLLQLSLEAKAEVQRQMFPFLSAQIENLASSIRLGAQGLNRITQRPLHDLPEHRNERQDSVRVQFLGSSSKATSTSVPPGKVGEKKVTQHRLWEAGCDRKNDIKNFLGILISSPKLACRRLSRSASLLSSCLPFLPTRRRKWPVSAKSNPALHSPARPGFPLSSFVSHTLTLPPPPRASRSPERKSLSLLATGFLDLQIGAQGAQAAALVLAHSGPLLYSPARKQSPPKRPPSDAFHCRRCPIPPGACNLCQRGTFMICVQCGASVLSRPWPTSCKAWMTGWMGAGTV